MFDQNKRGEAMTYEEAYTEGYAAKYEQWTDRTNPYQNGRNVRAEEGFDDGYNEAVMFA